MPFKEKNIFALLQSPGRLEIQSGPLKPEVDPEYVRLKVAYCGICGADWEMYKGHSRASYPRTLGHEYFGRIESTGEKVKGFKIGGLAAVDPNFRCGECGYCKSGASNHCVASGVNLFHPRGFARYVDIHCSYIRKIPDYSPGYTGALIEPLSVALHAVEKAEVTETDRVLIIGSGGIGSMISFAITTYFPALNFDVYDVNMEKTERLASVFTPNIQNIEREPEGQKYSLIFEATGKIKGFQTAQSVVDKRGRIVIISRYHDQRIILDNTLPYKECVIKFTHLNGDGTTFITASEMLSKEWKAAFGGLIKIGTLSELPSIIEALGDSVHNKTIIKIDEER
ncbi:alcohol dehydrogenase catalytic domain-containing protein [bacterium]|nr:alcohol dehydrogenase catalytic domain-containing protein [FCB group bacterium]MBL7191539.1 alcohol dehydrogenase catalytic domain-containing protein [bacterium]